MAEKSLVKTKFKIANAFEEILNTKPLSKISVTDLMNHCRMTRQTFYRNFLDLDDLIYWMHQEKISSAVQLFYHNKIYEESMKITLDLMMQNSTFYINATTTEGPNSFVSNFYEAMVNYSNEHIGYKRLSKDLEFAICLYWHGATAMLIQWIRDGMETSSEVMAKNFVNSLPAVLKKFYE